MLFNRRETSCPPQPYEAINFADKLSRIHETLATGASSPRWNDYQFKIVKIQGDFHLARPRRYRRKRSSCSKASCVSTTADGAVQVGCRRGEMVVVPKGKEHKPYAEKEVKLLLIEPRRCEEHRQRKRGEAHCGQRRLDLTRGTQHAARQRVNACVACYSQHSSEYRTRPEEVCPALLPPDRPKCSVGRRCGKNCTPFAQAHQTQRERLSR